MIHFFSWLKIALKLGYKEYVLSYYGDLSSISGPYRMTSEPAEGIGQEIGYAEPQ